MTAASAGPQFSADRRWWWTGSEWLPASQAPVQRNERRASHKASSSSPRRSGGLPQWLVVGVAILFFPITVVILIVRTKWSGRTKATLSGVWVVFAIVVGIAAGGSSGPSPTGQASVVMSPSDTPSPSLTATSPSATAATTPTPLAKPSPTPPAPSPKPTPPVPAQTVVRFVNAPLTARRGANATLRVTTAANTSCSIEVDYASGPSTAAGLGTKNSDGAGNVSWTWKVGAKTTPGSWPITVTCGSGSAQTHLAVT
jgi:hypothetical protein